MQNLKIKFIFNDCATWTTIPEKVAAVKAFYASKYDIQIDVVQTNFLNIPLVTVNGSDGSSGVEKIIQTTAIDPVWYDANITVQALGYDMVLFYIDHNNLVGHVCSAGIRGDDDQGPVELTIFGITEGFHAYQNGVDLGDCFTLFACHEITHGIFMKLGQPDVTHQYFYSTNPSAVLNCFNMNEQIEKPSQNSAVLGSNSSVQAPGAITSPLAKFPAKILAWKEGIKHWEGANPALHNCGNLKYTTLTASWGATKGPAASDGGNIAQFQSDIDGEVACCNFLTLGCENQLLAFHQSRTFELFTKVYAGNPPQNYINGVAGFIPCQLTDDISNFII